MSDDKLCEGNLQKQREKYKEILIKNGILNEIQSIDVITPDFAGNNFASKCSSVTIHFKRDENGEGRPPLELFVKNTIKDNEYAKILENMQVFKKEAIFFNSIYPRMVQFCVKKLENDEFLEEMFPKCFYADEEMIVMDNLNKKHYVMLDKALPHDLDLAKKVMELFAKFHAVTYTLIEDMGLEKFTEEYPTTMTSYYWSQVSEKLNAPYIKGIAAACLKTLKGYHVDGSQDLINYLTEFETNGFNQLCHLYNFKNNKSCALVLNHGDVWNCNLLFRQNSTGEFTSVTLIDLQMIHLGSPALDLQYYIYLSLSPQSRRENWTELLRVYYSTFKLNVEQLKGQVDFTLQELIDDYRRFCLPGFMCALYLVFGWETLDDFEDPQKIKDEDLEGYYTAALADVTTKAIGDKGHQFSSELVQAFHDYQNVINKG